jgi:tight adherence protein B
LKSNEGSEESEMALLLSILTFLIVAIIVTVLYLLLGGGAKEDIVGKRLESVRRAEHRGNVSIEVQILRDELLSTVPAVNRLLMKWSWASALKRLIGQAGLTVKPARVILLSAVLALPAYLVVSHLYRNTFLAVIGGTIGAVAPFAGIILKRGQRLRHFEEHLPEALDLLGRAVRAGHSFTTGLELIAQECGEPIQGEFRTTFEEQNLGLPLRESLLNLTERVPLVDVRLFVTALLIQKETGGNLAEILDELSRVIRERFRIYREVKVKTAQGRLTAAILIAMPLIMLAALGALNPGYVQVLFVDPTGRMMLIVAGAMQIFGSLLLWKIVNIDV